MCCILERVGLLFMYTLNINKSIYAYGYHQYKHSYSDPLGYYRG